MAKTLEEMSSFLVERNRQAREQWAHQLSRRAEVGTAMSEIIADPRWQIYVRHLEAMKTPEQAKIEQLKSDILDFSREFDPQQKLALAGATRYVAALDEAINLVQTLINQGEDATKAIDAGKL